MSTRSLLVAGCGYLGLAVARRFAEQGWTVLGLTHSVATADALHGEKFRVRACDIADATQVLTLAADEGRFHVALHCASSGRGDADAYRRVYLEGLRNIAEVLAPTQLIFTSSTSVYAQTDGGWVTEESPAEPPRETGRVLREAEEFALARGGGVLRLSALYGPARSVLLRKFFSGEAVIEDGGSRWINQIHRDDAAAAVVSIVEAAARGIFNVTDDAPTQQSAIYEYLAEHFSRPLPPRGPANQNRKRGVTSKRVANAKLHAFGWRPRYASFFQAVEEDPGIAAAAQSG